ncbi:glycosyltransferase family 1 protein [Niameybacter massiliensis]|uniref:glycosyltransferase family 1 protein n=1 Tax=Niameybacter massiliensis TaxID=1658108 RepID=UPI0006B4FFF1|nr:glycosyltransferase family 1 protein [Niameybacter massiliensis]
MEPVRVLHIVANMNRGGLENFLMNVYRTIDREQIQFDFLVTREIQGVFDEEICVLGGKIYNIPAMTKVGYWKYKKNVYEFFKAHEAYQIVHCHRDALGGVYLKQAYKAHVPFRIAHSHTGKIGEPRSIEGIIRSIIKASLKPLLNKYSTQRFACGKDAGAWLFGKKYNFQVINNGVNIEQYTYSKNIRQEIRQELDIDDQSFLLGHVGRFCYPKNHKFLIHMFSQLVQIIPQCKLCLVGTGELEEEIKALVHKLGLVDKVIFLGVREDVSRLLNAFDLFLFPSLLEGIPVTLIEAQVSGLSCIVSDKVTEEADLGIQLIEYLPINEVTSWLGTIASRLKEIDELREKRCTQIDSIRQRGYDSIQTAKYLETFYTNYSQKEGRMT